MKRCFLELFMWLSLVVLIFVGMYINHNTITTMAVQQEAQQ
jgi:hypothetical protein